LITCPDGNQQAAVLVGHIKELLKNGLAPEEIAVLYRSHYHSMEVQLQLQRQNIPYQIRGGLRFFEQAHIKDLVAFLRAVHNPCDRTAWLRILPMLPAVGVRTATRICQVLPQERQNLSAALTGTVKEIMPKKARESFVSMTRALQNAIDNWPSPDAILEEVSRGYYEFYLLSNYENPQRRLEDSRAVINFAEQYSQAEEFLGEIALSAEYSANPEQEVEGRAVAENRVVLSTVHQAKGLEWRAVLLPWLVEGRFPASQSLESEVAVEEERRIFHVAATRAEDWLIMYVPEAQRTKNNKYFSLRRSRFVNEIPDSLLRKIEFRHMTPEECSLFASCRASEVGRQFEDHTADVESATWLDDGLPVIWQD